jgi:hypothetical protein
MNPLTPEGKRKQLEMGADILAPVLVPHGFYFSIADSGNSSGGTFAKGEFKRGERCLEIHLRFSLGLVGYGLGANGISHESYMWVVTGLRKSGSYPGISDDLLDGFHYLRSDLEKYFSVFLCGSDDEFLQIIEKGKTLWAWYASLPPLKKLEVT